MLHRVEFIVLVVILYTGEINAETPSLKFFSKACQFKRCFTWRGKVWELAFFSTGCISVTKPKCLGAAESAWSPPVLRWSQRRSQLTALAIPDHQACYICCSPDRQQPRHQLIAIRSLKTQLRLLLAGSLFLWENPARSRRCCRFAGGTYKILNSIINQITPKHTYT